MHERETVLVKYMESTEHERTKSAGVFRNYSRLAHCNVATLEFLMSSSELVVR
jgi:hypothetical protein